MKRRKEKSPEPKKPLTYEQLQKAREMMSKEPQRDELVFYPTREERLMLQYGEKDVRWMMNQLKR
tara:strand:+ start:285 stop:479 length:195 start_codon:yes stop_codon:yes gene_type:complete